MPRRSQPPPPPPPSEPEADESTPITRQELRDLAPWLYPREYPTLFGDLVRRPFTLEDAIDELQVTLPHHGVVSELVMFMDRHPELRQVGNGRYVTDPDHEGTRATRVFARHLAREIPVIERFTFATAGGTDGMVRWFIEEKWRQAWSASASKLFVRVVSIGDRFNAAAYDPDSHAFHHFGDRAALLARLDGTDAVFGAREGDLERLGMSPRSRIVVPLLPPHPDHVVKRTGERILVTVEALVEGTLGADHRLGDADTMRRLLARGRHGRLERRLEADLKSLWRLYQYGVGHMNTWLRLAESEELIRVEWNVGSTPTVYQAIGAAWEAGKEVEIVAGSVPGWRNPWAQARTYCVLGREPDTVTLADAEGLVIKIPFRDIWHARARS